MKTYIKEMKGKIVQLKEKWIFLKYRCKIRGYRWVYRYKRVDALKTYEIETTLGKMYLEWFTLLKTHLDGLYVDLPSGKIELIKLSNRVTVPVYILNTKFLNKYLKDRKATNLNLHWYDLKEYSLKYMRSHKRKGVYVYKMAFFLSSILLTTDKKAITLPSDINKLLTFIDDRDLYVIERFIESGDINIHKFYYTWNNCFTRLLTDLK
mgnify:FL=1